MSEKTEQPTHKKLRETRQKGQVAHSKDFTQTFLIVSLFSYLLLDAETITKKIAELILMPVGLLNMQFEDAANILISEMLKEGAWILIPFLLIVLGVGVFAEVLQVGILFAFEAIKPSGKKLDVVANLKNIFSKKNLVEFLKSSAKVVFLSALIYFILKDNLPTLLMIPKAGIIGAGIALGILLKIMIINIAIAYIIISVADLAFQRHIYIKDLMMSKDEVQREYKEMEGDPQIKHQRKHLHQEMLMHGSVESTKKSSVLVTNPTHLAIAILYEKDETPLPIVLAKGEGALAEQMVKAALEANIPVLQNIPLAHALMDQAALNQYIPSELLEPMAEVLRLVRKIKATE